MSFNIMHTSTQPSTQPPNAAPSLNNNNTFSKRKLSQRGTLHDQHQAIGHAQITEIQRLSEELANCKSQTRIVTASNNDRESMSRPKNNYSTQAGSNEALKQILLAGQEYRHELLAAQDKCNILLRQNSGIQKQLEAMAREKDALLAQINNERSKTSILQQELFISKDTLQKYRQRFDVERSEMGNEIKALRANTYNLEQVTKELAAKAGLLPFYQQKIADDESKIGLLGQEMQQIRTQLRYYQEKSNYFENNYTVLNDNFNNLYNLNFTNTNTIKQLKLTNSNLENTLKSMEEECKRLGNRCLEIAEDKNRQIGQLSQRLAQQSERVKVQSEALHSANNKNDKLTISLQESKKIEKELDGKNDCLRKEFEDQSRILHGQKIMNEQLIANIKDLQANHEKKEAFWKNSLANELLKMSNESSTKLFTVSTELIKSEENVKLATANLRKYESELNIYKEKASQLEGQLSQSKIEVIEKQKFIAILQQTVQQAKKEESSLKNSISEYEQRLSTALTIQEQTNIANRLTIEEKSQRIKELEQAVKHQQGENTVLKKKNSEIMEEIAKSTELDGRKIEWLNEQNLLKQKIIAQYNSVTDEMREKISADHQDILELSKKNTQLNEQIARMKEINMQNQGILLSQGQLIEKQYNSIKYYEEELNKRSLLIAELEKAKKEILNQQQQSSEKLKIMNEQLRQKTDLLKDTQNAHKQAISGLKLQKQSKTAQIAQEYETKVEALKAQNKRLEQFSQQMFNDFKFTVEALRTQIGCLHITNQQNSSQLALKTAKIQEQEEIISRLKDQNEKKDKNIELINAQNNEMAKIVQRKTHEMKELQEKMMRIEEDHRKTIEEQAQSHINKSKALLSQWTAEKDELTQQVSEGYSHLQSKRQLQNQLTILKSQYQNIKIELEGQQSRSQNLSLQNDLIRKSLIQMQQSLTSRFQAYIATKSKFQQQQTQRLSKEIQRLTAQKLSLQGEKNSLTNKNAQKDYNISNLFKENERLDQIIRRNIQISKSQSQFLKKANMQLQIELQRVVQVTQSESRTKNELSQSVSSLQLRNAFLEGYMERTKGELDSIQRILSELKEERDLLIKKYIILTNEIYKFNSKDINLNRELDSFAQYFSKVSTLHTKINKHLFNISQLSKPNKSSVRQSSRFEESMIDQK